MDNIIPLDKENLLKPIWFGIKKNKLRGVLYYTLMIGQDDELIQMSPEQALELSEILKNESEIGRKFNEDQGTFEIRKDKND